MGERLNRWWEGLRRLDDRVARLTGPGTEFDRRVEETRTRAASTVRQGWSRVGGAPALDRAREPARRAGTGVRRGLAFAATEPTGLVGAVVVFVFAWLIVTLFWDVLSLPPRFVSALVSVLTPTSCDWAGSENIVSDNVCGTVLSVLTVVGVLVSIGLAILIRIPVRRMLGAAFGWLPAEASFLAGPLLTTALFTMGWAGLQFHFRERPGIVEDGHFPVLVGLATYGLMRAWPLLQEHGGGFFDWRDRVERRIRWGVVLGIPIGLSVLGTPLFATPVRDQVVALSGLLIGYAFLAPAGTAEVGPEAPEDRGGRT